MLILLLAAQIVVAVPPADSTYATPALREFVAAAADSNRRAPAALASYTSQIETEASLLIRDTLGREDVAEVEQFATRAEWERSGGYDLHVIGYRAQSVGVPYSTLSIVRAWTVPTLYGERLSMGVYFDRGGGREASDSLRAVHPFAADRDLYYQYSGGDTVTTLRAGARTIPIVRIRVRPRFQSLTPLGAFDGEIDLDGTRKQIVRMRGRFVVLGDAPSAGERIARRMFGVQGVAYVELVNAEIGGKYWLPSFQRTEFQASFAAFGRLRPVFRIVSSIRNIRVTERDTATLGAAAVSQALDTVSLGVAPQVTITWAPADSVDTYDEWRHSIGAATNDVASSDFDDLAPDAWRATGPARLDLYPTSVRRVFRFNRVEGLYLGVAPTIDFRSTAPGLKVGVYGGWAFSEHTARGGIAASFDRGLDHYSARAERSLVSTNDFAPPLDEDPGLAALLSSIDDYDYVDRSQATVTYARVLGDLRTGVATAEIGVARDAPEHARLERGLFGPTDFRMNRGADRGSYGIARVALEWHPNVSGDFVTPGIGGRIANELARGELNWDRVELSASLRKYLGPLNLSLHADAGGVFGASPPPQTLFELGGDATLPGYDYKQFVGDRGALARAVVGYRFDLWKRPIRVRRLVLPGVSPGVAVSAQGGWTELTSSGARAAARTLGLDPSGAPIASPSNGVRATVGGGLTFFSDLVHIGVARPADHPGPWRWVFGVGTVF
jgi:hypothetical protein